MTETREPTRTPSIQVCLLTLYLHESLGIRQLCSVLQQCGHRCALIFFKEFRWGEFSPVKPAEEQLLLDLLRELKPQLVGINLTSSFVADLAYALSEKIRDAIGVPVILGGAHVSACPEASLEHADLVCLGEGEEALVEVADAIACGKSLTNIPNIWTKVEGEIHRNEVRPLEQNLDRYPPVAYGEDESYFIEECMLQRMDPATLLQMYHTTASRMGCPFSCTFCAGVYLRQQLYAGKGQVRRHRSVSAILDEIKQALPRNPQVKIIQFWDEVFGAGAPAGWMEEFCTRFPQEIDLPFGIWSHPALITEAYVQRLQAAGLSSAVIGVESGSAQVRREVLNRRETNETILRAADILHRHGIKVGYDFILDIPWLPEENCRGTFDLVMQLPHPFEVGLHSLTLLPCTGLAERALSEGKIRPEQIAQADRPLAERFESFRWKYRLGAAGRRAAFWHSMIYLASMPFVPRTLLRRALRLRFFLQYCPRPLMLAAEVARLKQATGETKFFPALEAVYPRLAGFLARHPALGRLLNSTLRRTGRLTRRLLRV